MVITRSQLENLSKEELIDRLLQVENIEDKLEHLKKRFDDFLGKCNELHSELQVSKNCSKLLRNRVIVLEKMHLVQRSTLEKNLSKSAQFLDQFPIKTLRSRYARPCP